MSCPLCFYNLEGRQDMIARAFPGFEPFPVVYFTQLLAMAMGVDDPATLGLEEAYGTAMSGLLDGLEPEGGEHR